MKNTLTDLNNHLFEVLERLADEDLSEEQMDREIARSEAITKVAQTVISNGELALRAMKVTHWLGLKWPKQRLKRRSEKGERRMIIPIKSKFKQMLCKHKYRAFEKPIDRKTNPYGFIPLNGPETVWVCVECGKVAHFSRRPGKREL